MERYDITKLPKSFFIKMAKVYDGSLNDIKQPVPPEHLYDMWCQKEQYLNKVYMNNISKGKKMKGYLRLNYDLAILLSKYDDYLKWLDRQKTVKAEDEEIKESVSTTEILYTDIKKQENNNNDNLIDILDELI